MNEPRVPLFERLPEIYRTRDAEQQPPNPLRAFLGAIEAAFGALHADIAQRYEDLFIDTCADWVVPYIGDLLGTSHLKGEPRTLRADVADTIALRRRKGTLGAIERLAFDLTGWACRAVELRDNLAWTQHLNHQRPDAGGVAPLSNPALTRFDLPRGGTLPIRDPRELALLGSAFDRFAYTADTKPALDDARHVNLPDLAIFVWRLAAFRLPLVQPLAKGASDLGPQTGGRARFALRFDLHPLDLPVRLFNTGQSGVPEATFAGGVAPLTSVDGVPGPMLDARLTSGLAGASPADYVRIDFFDDSAPIPAGDAGLHLFLPASLAPLLVRSDGGPWAWTFRGDNLCAWETGLRRPLASGEIVIDTDIGRVLIGLDTPAQRDKLIGGIDGPTTATWFASFTYGAAGPVGAHPVPRAATPGDEGAELRRVGRFGALSLQQALEGLDVAGRDVIVQIGDSFVHRLDLDALAGTQADSRPALRLARSLTIRAASDQRPVVLLAQPLGFRPVDTATANSEGPRVRLEGLYLAPHPASFPNGAALIARAAVARLEIVGCTLAPGGHARRDGSRAAPQPGLALANGYGFDDPGEESAFAPTPQVLLQRSISGSIAIDDRYALGVESSVVDAGCGVGGDDNAIAIGPVSTDPNAPGAPLDFDGLTCFGAVRTLRAGGLGGLFTRRFEAFDNQHGCIKRSWFGGNGDRLPPNHLCLRAADAPLRFAAERFNDPGYAQVARASDLRIRTLGPDDDTMGAFGFQLEAHKWTNLQVRLREFMPVGVRPLVVPVT
jgi:hypothetical protein